MPKILGKKSAGFFLTHKNSSDTISILRVRLRIHNPTKTSSKKLGITMEPCSKIWDDILENVREKLGPLRFNLWFKNTRLESIGDAYASIAVPNIFTQMWLQENFSGLLKEGIGRFLNRSELDIRFILDNKQEKEIVLPEKPVVVEEKGAYTGRKALGLNKGLLLDDFVIGPNNRLAYTAALEMIKEEYPPFNPLFIHGNVGVGKTHLLVGIWNRVRKEQTVNAVYMSAEKWTNEFIYALQKGKMESFRQRYRNVDVFLIDDVHFLSNKQGVQEEFLHTFNALYDSSKRIIFASDAHPRQISQLKENLASRFMSGMVARIERPEYATRLLILRTKASKYDVYFPEEALEYIAEKFDDSVREVESALVTLTAHARFNDRKIDLAFVKDVLKEFFYGDDKVVKVEEIEGAVLRHFNISRSDLHSSRKAKTVSFPRQICMYLIKNQLDWSYQQIGNYFGNKKHTTVIFAIKKINEELKKDDQFKSFLDMLMEKIKKAKK